MRNNPKLYHCNSKTKTLPTVLDTHKVQLLKELESDSTRGDYVHSWWDWGTQFGFTQEMF